MKYYKILIYIIIMSFSFFTGCSSKPKKGEIIAEVGDTAITASDFYERISNLPLRYQEFIKRRKSKFLDEIINDTLLYQEAARKGIDKDEEVLKVVEEARKKIIIARLLKDEVDDKVEITEDEIVKEYNDNKNEYMLPELMRVSHILVPTKEQAEGIVEELRTGAPFDAVARAKSVDPTAQNGGDIGYFPKGQLMPEFENACSQLEIGEISGPVKTKLGYHVIKLTDRKEATLRPLEKVADRIKAKLYKIKKRETFNKILEDLKKNTKITINKDLLESELPLSGSSGNEEEEKAENTGEYSSSAVDKSKAE